ncbi:MAG: polysaccharide deacetylase family protein, partial [Rhodospirillales bacterium]|nr:polysaccharide deacetylase family protein [Rhodospirillales bacterium]
MPYESNAGHAAALSNDGPPCGGFRAISIDVEEYFQIEAAHAGIPRSDWPHWPSRIERQMDTLFELFARRGVRATMFFLGCVAEQHPQLVRRAVASGHEIASHGYFHDRLHRLTPQQLRDELTRSRRLLEDLAGQQVRGYRAPTWSITRETAWAI